MILVLGFIVGIVYGICHCLCGQSSSASIGIICGIIVVIALIAGFATGTVLEMLCLGIIIALVAAMGCSHSATLERDENAYKKAVDKQKRQEKYDNEYGNITSHRK